MTTVTILDESTITVEVSGAFPAGAGVPSGGLTGQVLAKNSNGNYDTEWTYAGAGGTWGNITGDIANQTDLIAALDAAGRVYVQDAEPGLDTETGDIWFNATTNVVKYKSAGTWTSPVVDAGQY